MSLDVENLRSQKKTQVFAIHQHHVPIETNIALPTTLLCLNVYSFTNHQFFDL